MKRIISLLLVLCTLCALAACGTPTTPVETQPQHIHSFGEWTVTKNATCTESGEQERYCSCGEKQTQTIAATGHTFGDWTITKEPTCTETGEQERYCSCGEKQTQSVAAKGHSFGEWITTKDPTCTEAGEQERTCSCGEKETQTVSAAGHDFGEWTTDKQPTCTADGKKSRKCKNCGAAEEEAIPATGHQWQEATCTEPKTCLKCKATEGSALGHDYKDGTCIRCNEILGATIILPSAGKEYSVYSLSSGKKLCTYKIIKIEAPVLEFASDRGLYYSVKITMKSTYDNAGNNFARHSSIAYEIHDGDKLVKRDNIFGDSIKVGETCEKIWNIYYLEAGHTYTVEFLDFKD